MTFKLAADALVPSSALKIWAKLTVPLSIHQWLWSTFCCVVNARQVRLVTPGEHNGTFRGNNHAFVTAAAALEEFWQDDSFAKTVREKGAIIAERMQQITQRHSEHGLVFKGRGMMIGIACPNGEIAEEVCGHAFENGLVIETSGAHSEVVKCLCPLTISHEQIDQAMTILDNAFAAVLPNHKTVKTS